MKIFVYGTLKSNHGANSILGSSPFVDDAITVNDGFNMHDGGYPRVTIDGVSHIRGELYEVTSDRVLEHLDSYEGHPHLFHRHTVDVKTDSGEVYEAQMYVYSSKINSGRKVVPNDNNVCEWR